MDLEKKLSEFLSQPKNPDANFNLGLEYFKLNQTTSAYSYFLRTAEFSDDTDLIYESLILCGKCLGLQRNHNKSEKGMYLHAISLDPDRPEGYYFLSKFYEEQKDWIDVYTIATIGLKNLKFKFTRSILGYGGEYTLHFQRAMSVWWLGRHHESMEIFNYLFDEKENVMDSHFKEIVHNNLVFLNQGEYPKLPYTRLIEKKLRIKFNGVDTIKKNYSQSYQDMFVLTMLNGKKNGTYVEIGSSDPFSGNNTALLETEFGWRGISFDIQENEVNKFKEQRKNPVFLADATQVNYSEVFKENKLIKQIDYLQLDCDPPSVTYEILTKIPFDEYKFAVITYEHDYYIDDTKSYRDKSREYLKLKGYELVASNIAPNDTDTYEDWWIYPGLVNSEYLDILRNSDDSIKNAEKYMTFLL